MINCGPFSVSVKFLSSAYGSRVCLPILLVKHEFTNQKTAQTNKSTAAAVPVAMPPMALACRRSTGLVVAKPDVVVEVVEIMPTMDDEVRL